MLKLNMRDDVFLIVREFEF